MRLADNEALAAAASHAFLLPVFTLDPADLLPRPRRGAGGGTGVPLLGPHRLRQVVTVLFHWGP
jgi:hypothetical protein